MLGTAINIFKIPDLRNKILFTFALLLIYRTGNLQLFLYVNVLIE